MKTLLTHKYPAILLAVIILASVVGINQYQFGLWNQYISLPWLYDMLNPELYPNELLVEQRENSPTIFLHLIQFLLPLTAYNIPVLFFSLYLVAHIFTILGFYKLSMSMFKNQKSALFSVVMLSFAFPVIGDVELWSTYLMERTLSYPFLVFSLAALFRKKYWAAVLLQALAFNLHPLSTIYVMAGAWTGVLFARGWSWKYMSYAAVFIVASLPVLYLKMLSGGSLVTGEMQAVWMQVMKLRNAHHAMPSAFPLAILLKSAMVALAFGLLIWRSKLPIFQERFLKGFALATVLMLLVGTIFTEFYPLKSILQFQFFRSYRFFILLTIVLFSGMMFRQPRPLHFAIAPLLLLQYVYGEPAKSAAAIGIICLAWFALNYHKFQSLQKAGLLGAFLVLGIFGYALRGGIDINEPRFKDDWKDLQKWVAINTDNDVIVIVPPQEPGFRVLSQRASYGDWYDGTKAFFSEEYAAFWLGRMESLGCTDPKNLREDYMENTEDDFRRIAQTLLDTHSTVLIAQYSQKDLNLPVHYSNGSYKLYAVQ